MKLWKRVSGALKDHNSLWVASLTRRSELRNPDIEAAVIKATSHDESRVDFRNAQRVFAWIRVSHSYLHSVLWAISIRMEKTRSWVVALKGLMLLHGVFCCKVPAVQKIGRLPFDLSNFKDGHSSPAKMWDYNCFVRAYYAFLDQKSSFLFLHSQEMKEQRKRVMQDEREEKEKKTMMEDLVWLRKLQGLLDMLLQIKPQSNGLMADNLILEAMDCIVIEIFDVYSRICNGIAGILLSISWAGKIEALMALAILQKLTVQGEELALYFAFCTDIGVINASECPKVEQIPEEDIRELEDLINGAKHIATAPEDQKAIIVAKENKTGHQRNDSQSSLQTIITDNWEVFEEDPKKLNQGQTWPSVAGKNNARVNPNELPDLISF